MSGVISGFKNEEGYLVFSSAKPVSYAEAAVMLNNVLELSDVSASGLIDSVEYPAWAYQATLNLYACDVVPYDAVDLYDSEMTRGEAAVMLTAAMKILEARDSGGSLLSWAK
jgi:hypothetical protein